MQRKIYHLEYKHKEGKDRHKYYTNLSNLCRFNTLIGVKYPTLARKSFEEPYENNTVIIRYGELIDKTVKKPQKGGRL